MHSLRFVSKFKREDNASITIVLNFGDVNKWPRALKKKSLLAIMLESIVRSIPRLVNKLTRCIFAAPCGPPSLPELTHLGLNFAWAKPVRPVGPVSWAPPDGSRVINAVTHALLMTLLSCGQGLKGGFCCELWVQLAFVPIRACGKVKRECFKERGDFVVNFDSFWAWPDV